MKIAWLSPLPPVRSGIAGYSMMILPEMAKLAEVTVVVDQNEVDPRPPCEVISIEKFDERRDQFDTVIAQIGNNPHHEYVWREAREHPAVLVLHEVVLHHLVTEVTLARGAEEEFETLMRASDGSAGHAFARARSCGIHFETGNFFFPGSAQLAASARAVIVHNRWAREQLREAGVRTPIHVIDHPLDELHVDVDGDATSHVRETHGFPEGSEVIGMFGFVTQPKRPGIVFEAFGRAYRRDPNLRLLVVGESAPNIDLESLAGELAVPRDAWSATGWVSDEEFDAALTAVDRVVSLRYPSAGESSGAVVRVFAAGKPIAVSDYAQFADLPDEVVFKIPLGGEELDALVRFMTEEIDLGPIASAQKEWIRNHGDPFRIAREYLDVVSSVTKRETPSPERTVSVSRSTLGLLPQLTVPSIDVRRDRGALEIEMTLENEGETELRSHVWGVPAYRLIVKALSDGAELASAWWPLPADLAPGQSLTVRGRLRAPGADEVALLHGWVDVPLVDETPFFSMEVAR